MAGDRSWDAVAGPMVEYIDPDIFLCRTLCLTLMELVMIHLHVAERVKQSTFYFRRFKLKQRQVSMLDKQC
jgi:hypothetical protein